MKVLIKKINHFLESHPDNVITIEYNNIRLSKKTPPKYSFNTNDIREMFGDVNNLLKSLPDKGFKNGTTVSFRRRYKRENTDDTYYTIEKITLNFPNHTNAEPMTETILPATTENAVSTHMVSPQTPVVLGMPSPSMLGYAQVPQQDWVASKVKEERYEDLRRLNDKLEEEIKDYKSEIRQLKDENFSLRLKIDTSEEKHAVQLEREALNRKNFFDSEAGGKIVDALGAVLPVIAEKAMASSTPLALGGADLSPVKKQFIQIINQHEITDEQVTEWYNLIFSENGTE